MSESTVYVHDPDDDAIAVDDAARPDIRQAMGGHDAGNQNSSDKQ